MTATHRGSAGPGAVCRAETPPSAQGGRHGFTLVEVLIALLVVGALAVVCLQTTALGNDLRFRARTHALLRPLAEQRLAELAALAAPELRARMGRSRGRFAPPWEAAEWRARITEQDPSLFRVELEVGMRGATLRAATYLNRADEAWVPDTGGERRASP